MYGLTIFYVLGRRCSLRDVITVVSRNRSAVPLRNIDAGMKLSRAGCFFLSGGVPVSVNKTGVRP